MEEENKKSCAAHGDKATAKERRLSIKKGSFDYNKWCENYSITDDKLEKIFND